MSSYKQVTKHFPSKKKFIKAFTVASSIILSSSVCFAGKITSQATENGTPGFSGFNKENIEVLLNGTKGSIGSGDSWYDLLTGSYNFADDSDFTYQANILDSAQTGVRIS
ncbi:MAG: hypothetical protein V7782_11110 [Psychromonas sp.]